MAGCLGNCLFGVDFQAWVKPILVVNNTRENISDKKCERAAMLPFDHWNAPPVCK